MAKVEHRRPRSRTGLAPRWPAILTPIAVFFIAGFAPLLGMSWEKLIGGILALGLILVISRRPSNCFLALVTLLPWHVVGLSTLYRIGVPGPIVRVGVSWKEAILLGLLVAAIRQRRLDKKPFDRLDKLIFAFLALNAFYLVLPRLFVLGDAPMGWNHRFLGFRSNVFFFVLLFVARRIPFDAKFRKRLVPAMLLSATTTALFGIWNWAASNSWNDFVVNTIRVPRYLIEVINAPPPNPADLRRYTDGGDAVRASSSLFEPVMFGIFLVIAFGIGLALLARRRSGVGPAIGVLCITAAMVLTQTRAALLGAFIVAVLVLRSPGGHRPARAKLGLLLVAGVVFAIPAGLAVGVVQRSLDAFGGGDESSSIHGDDFERGLEGLAEHPLGLGLGTGASIGLRFDVQNSIISENAYFQVGNEIGVAAMVLFIAIWISTIQRLRRRAREPDNPDSYLAATFAAIGCGFLAMAFLQQVWVDYAVVVAFWGPAGVLLSVVDRRDDEDDYYGSGRYSRYGGGGMSSNSYP